MKCVTIATVLLLLEFVPIAVAAENCQLYSVSPQSGSTSPGITVVLLGNGFSKTPIPYFDGMAARSTTVISPSRIEAVTPYLRPGEHSIQVDCPAANQAFDANSPSTLAREKVIFQSLPSVVDAKLDSAWLQARYGQPGEAIKILDDIARSDSDRQVRAYAWYAQALLYYTQGNWNNWADACLGIWLDAQLAGRSIQTYWPYLLENARAHYLLIYTKPEDDFSELDWVVEADSTEHPQPRFWRGLVGARIGKLDMAKSDSAFCLERDPSNASYLALAAFIAAAAGDQAQAESLRSKALGSLSKMEQPDAKALSLLGEGSYISGKRDRATQDWAEAARADPLLGQIAELAGKKHLWRGEPHIAAMLLNEAITMLPAGTPEGDKARRLLQGLPSR
jgi:tetratricopeptide (TPR) repeat protein